jgi:cell fate regulator YaaT (PSP1 superfamily)
VGRVAGIRFGRAGPVHYYAADGPLVVGDYVVAETTDGPALGRVVIAPKQLVVNELPEAPQQVVRRAAADDLRRFDIVDDGERERWLLFGAESEEQPRDVAAPLGFAARLSARLGEANRRYVEQKARLPQLGQIVQTPAGPGRVVRVQVLRERITVQMDEGTVLRFVGPDLQPLEEDEDEERRRPRPGRRRRRGRGARPAEGDAAKE